MSVAAWLEQHLQQIEQNPDAGAALAHLWQVVDNEMQHGMGQTKPAQLVLDLVEAGGALTSAVLTNTPAAPPPPPAHDADYGTVASVGSVSSVGETSTDINEPQTAS